jgi:RNA polymerase sigma factor (sigma-70 family)
MNISTIRNSGQRCEQVMSLRSNLLYNQYFQVLFSYGKRLAADEIVCDAIQDLFINIWRNRHTLSQAESVRFYLFRSVRREIVKNLKNEPHRQDWEELDENLLPVDLSPESVYAGHEETFEQSEQIRRWLDQLPPRQNEALFAPILPQSRIRPGGCNAQH